MYEALFYGYGVLLLFEPLEQSASIESVRNGNGWAMFEIDTVLPLDGKNTVVPIECI